MLSADRDERLKKVMERVTKRWVAPRARVLKDGEEGDTTAEATASGPEARTPIDVPVPKRAASRPKRRIIRSQGGDTTIGQVDTGIAPASRVDAAQGYPAVEWVKLEDINDRGMVAAWTFPNSTYPFGLIEIDETHPVVRGQVDYWKEQYPAGMATDVERIVKDAYEDVAVAEVTHMHSLQKAKVFTEDQRAAMLQNPALTTSLLGLIGEDALITPGSADWAPSAGRQSRNDLNSNSRIIAEAATFRT